MPVLIRDATRPLPSRIYNIKTAFPHMANGQWVWLGQVIPPEEYFLSVEWFYRSLKQRGVAWPPPPPPLSLPVCWAHNSNKKKRTKSPIPTEYFLMIMFKVFQTRMFCGSGGVLPCCVGQWIKINQDEARWMEMNQANIIVPEGRTLNSKLLSKFGFSCAFTKHHACKITKKIVVQQS